MNPMKVAQNRTARLAAEAATPVYSTDTASAAAKREREHLARIEDHAVTEDFCFICSRCTDHRGEHDDAQLLAWAKRPSFHQRSLWL